MVMATLVDPWKFHAQHFPYCPYVLKFKSPSFILACLNQYKNSTSPRQRYNYFFQHHLQYIRPDTFCTDLLNTSNIRMSVDLLQNLTKHHVLFMNILLCYATPMADSPASTYLHHGLVYNEKLLKSKRSDDNTKKVIRL